VAGNIDVSRRPSDGTEAQSGRRGGHRQEQ